jgi:hypothetical protein
MWTGSVLRSAGQVMISPEEIKLRKSKERKKNYLKYYLRGVWGCVLVQQLNYKS